MRFLRAFFMFFIAATLAPRVAFAQISPTDVSTGYSNIMSQGIIFAHICPSAVTPGSVDTCQCRAVGACTVTQIIQMILNLTIFALGICGSVALLMFFYGGWQWVFAQGRPEVVQAGKDTIKHAIIGLAIIFGAYSMINLAIAILGGITPGATLEDTIDALPTTTNGSSTPLDGSGVINSL